jgi:hypothetical protein
MPQERLDELVREGRPLLESERARAAVARPASEPSLAVDEWAPPWPGFDWNGPATIELVPDVGQPSAEQRATMPAEGHRGDFDAWLEPGSDWLAAAVTDTKALVSGILPQGALVGVGGPKAAGKSWLLQDLALSLVNNKPFLGRFPVELDGPVLYIATEGSRVGFRNRLSSLARGKGLEPERALHGLDFVWRRGLLLDDQACLNWLRGMAFGYAAIIVDTLRDAWSGEENSNDAGGKLARALRTITNEGPSLLLAQHARKSSTENADQPLLERFRGNSALVGAFDGAIILERGKNASRTTASVYLRDDVAADGFSFAWPAERIDGTSPVTLDWQLGDQVVSAAVDLVPTILQAIESQPGMTRRALRDKLKGNTGVFQAAVDLLLKQDRISLRPVSRTDRRGRSRLDDGLFLASSTAVTEPRSENGVPQNHGQQPDTGSDYSVTTVATEAEFELATPVPESENHDGTTVTATLAKPSANDSGDRFPLVNSGTGVAGQAAGTTT